MVLKNQKKYNLITNPEINHYPRYNLISNIKTIITKTMKRQVNR